MFIGEYTHTLDDKKRLSLPSRFRKDLGRRVVVTPGLDGCLFVFSGEQWKSIAQSLSRASMLQADSRGFNRYFLGGAQEAEIDSAGRILIPDFLCRQAHLKDNVSIIGVSNRVELWNESAWQDYKKIVGVEAKSLAEKLGQVGVL